MKMHEKIEKMNIQNNDVKNTKNENENDEKSVFFFEKIFLFTSVIFQKFKKVWKVQKVSFPKLWTEFWFLFFSFPFWVLV